MKFRVSGILALILAIGVLTPDLIAQNPNPEDATLNGIRRLNTIGNLDQESIRRWIQHEMNNLTDLPRDNGSDGFDAAGFRTFLTRLEAQRKNAANTNAFLTQLATQAAVVADQTFKQSNGSVTASRALARMMTVLRAPETIPGLLAGLTATDSSTKFLCLKALTNLRSAINQDNNLSNQIIQALRAAGAIENDPIVLGQIYVALSIPNDLTASMDIYLEIFDRRLNARRQQTTKVDSAELFAFEIFRQPNNLNKLNQNQKASLVQRLAVFLRMDAVRYNDPTMAPPTVPKLPDLSFYERDKIERRMDAAEDIISAIAGSNKGGQLRDVLNNKGYAGRTNILEEVYKWMGKAESNTRGPLNDAPWNVPVGAP